MKYIRKIITFFLAIMLILSTFSIVFSVQAASAKTGGSTKYGGNVVGNFYLTTNSVKEKKVTMKQTQQGVFADEASTDKKLYGYYELLIYGIKNGKETYIKKVNVKNSQKYDVSFKDYTKYRIRVYCWKTATIATQQKVTFSQCFTETSYWKTLPKYTFTTAWLSGVTIG